ncbi:MAG: NAD(P)-binding domain-containing protein [Oligoflexales bacterium]|nr:NAD(P)-binding domain-containing protein [Oligoflexales bacterium]
MKIFSQSRDVRITELPHQQKASDANNFSQELFGKSPEVAKSILEGNAKLKDLKSIPITQQIRDFVFLNDNRKVYVDSALEYLRNKQLQASETYDAIIVGAGIHAATCLHALRKKTPHVKVLIVEKTTTISSTFANYGDSLVLNSPTYVNVGLDSNVIPGHFIQASDFDELVEKPFPTAKHLFELAVMVLFHSDADIAFDFNVEDVHKIGSCYFLESKKRVFTAKSLVIANGMGGPREHSFLKDRPSDKLISGDDFIIKSRTEHGFLDSFKGKDLAIIGAGDTANCVLEYILPTIYPNMRYGFHREYPTLPRSVYWIGQNSPDIKSFFFKNKRRYCHSGGLIEFFWEGDMPFDLPVDQWKQFRKLIKIVPDKLISIAHKPKKVEITSHASVLAVDLVIDCTGRYNQLSSSLLKDEYEFVEGDIVFYGGCWNEGLERFASFTRTLKSRRLACKLKGEKIFFLGSSCPLGELIDDDEAKNGSSQYQEDRISLTNSKWSLEHTLPRTAAFSERFEELLDVGQDSSV